MVDVVGHSALLEHSGALKATVNPKNGSWLQPCHTWDMLQLNATYFGMLAGWLQADRPFSLDKSKGIVYVLMGEHTQGIGFVWIVWQSSSTGIV